jgi:hypothetical protein
MIVEDHTQDQRKEYGHRNKDNAVKHRIYKRLQENRVGCKLGVIGKSHKFQILDAGSKIPFGETKPSRYQEGYQLKQKIPGKIQADKSPPGQVFPGGEPHILMHGGPLLKYSQEKSSPYPFRIEKRPDKSKPKEVSVLSVWILRLPLKMVA